MEFMRSELTNNLPISGLVDLVISYFIPRQTILRKEAQQQMRSPEIPLWSYYDSIRNEWKELHLPPLPYEAEQAVDSCLDIIYERHISQFRVKIFNEYMNDWWVLVADGGNVPARWERKERETSRGEIEIPDHGLYYGDVWKASEACVGSRLFRPTYYQLRKSGNPSLELAFEKGRRMEKIKFITTSKWDQIFIWGTMVPHDDYDTILALQSFHLQTQVWKTHILPFLTGPDGNTFLVQGDETHIFWISQNNVMFTMDMQQETITKSFWDPKDQLCWHEMNRVSQVQRGAWNAWCVVPYPIPPLFGN